MEKNEENFNFDKRFVYGLVIIGLIVAVYFIAFDTTTSNILRKDSAGSEIDEVRARVNGFSVYDSDVQRVKTVYEAQSGRTVGQDAALERAIADVLVSEEAKRRGIEVSIPEAQEKLSSLANEQGLSIEQVKKGYEDQGKDFNEVLQDYATQLSIDKLADEVIGDVGQVTEIEVATYYEENKKELFSNSEVIVPYKDVSEQLKLAMSQKKEQEVFNDIVKIQREKEPMYGY